MSDSKPGVRLLRFIWRLIPWLAVGLLVYGAVDLLGKVKQEQAQLAEAKKAALKAEVPATRVIVMELKPRRILDAINLPAVVEPFEEVWVRAEVAGQVVEVLAKEGQEIKKGQALVRLDDRDYRARLSRVEANYAYAKAEYDRFAALTEKRVTAKSKLDSLEAQLKDLAAQAKEARLALARTKITAPISSRLNQVIAREGDLLKVGDQVAQIIEIERVKVTVGVPESDVAAIYDLQEAEVTIQALGNLKVKGRKYFLSRKPSDLARLYNLELEVPNSEGRILPGMFAQVQLIKRVFDQALSVPLYAVITQGQETYVFVEQDGLASKRPVRLGVLEGWQVQITGAVKPGDKVVVVGHRLLDDGQKVEVIKTVSDPGEILG